MACRYCSSDGGDEVATAYARFVRLRTGMIGVMDILGRKHESLRLLVSELVDRLPPRTFVVVDHWEADPFAIGLAKPTDPDHLVYITSDRDVHGRFFMSRELPSDSDLVPYREAGAEQFESIDDLAAAIAIHLHAA